MSYLDVCGMELKEAAALLEEKGISYEILETKPPFAVEGEGRKIVILGKETDDHFLLVVTNEKNRKIYEKQKSSDA